MNLQGDSLYPCDSKGGYKGKIGTPELIRFWSKTLIGEDGCWLWIGALHPKGYGGFKPSGGRPIFAHSWVATNFHKWPKRNHKTRVVDHICRNTSCVRPSHLRLVTAHDNAMNGKWALTTHCPQGHAYSPENLVTCELPRRVCRPCKNARLQLYSVKRRAARLALKAVTK